MNESTYLEEIVEPMSENGSAAELKPEPEEKLKLDEEISSSHQENILEESLKHEPSTDESEAAAPPASILKEIETLSPYEKVKKAIEIMNKAISSNPCNFREFWETRKWVMPFLKEVQQPNEKAEVWNEISHLTQEVRRQKEAILKESAFAQEQIEIAISALEKELLELVPPTHPGLELPSGILELHQKFYIESQGELNLLNAYAMRINSLRKELMRTSLKVKAKSNLFDRLSKAGDKIFPKRKVLIQGVSDTFVKDVTNYCNDLNDIRKAKKKLMEVRDEIKELQRIAKLLTLNTFAFNSTRVLLSDLWDKIKLAERERKKEMAVFKADSEKLLEELMVDVHAIKAAQEEGSSNRQIEHLLSELMTKSRAMRLDRQHVTQLKEAIQPIKDALEAKVQEEVNRRLLEDTRKEKERKDKIDAVFAEFDALLSSSEEDIKAFETQVQKAKETFLTLPLQKKEKLEGEKVLKQLQNSIVERKEKAILNLSEDDKATIDHLKEILASRLERKREVKERIESLRKSRGGSGLDFEQALNLDAQIKEEKEALEEIDKKVFEIQKQIDLIKSK